MKYQLLSVLLLIAFANTKLSRPLLKSGSEVVDTAFFDKDVSVLAEQITTGFRTKVQSTVLDFDLAEY